MSVPTEDRRIEMFVSPSGSRVLYCGLCRENTYEGQLTCCEWALGMVTKYFKTKLLEQGITNTHIG
jgi:hypothetical protein